MINFFGEQSPLADAVFSARQNWSPSEGPMFRAWNGTQPDPIKRATRGEFTISDEALRMASQDQYAKRIFGDKAPEIYARGYRPTNIDGKLVYFNPSQNFDVEGGGRVVLVPKGGKLTAGVMKDGKIAEFTLGELDKMDPADAVDFAERMYVGRFNQIGEGINTGKIKSEEPVDYKSMPAAVSKASKSKKKQ